TNGADAHSAAIASAGNGVWSLYGAPWSQPVATGGKSARPRNGETKPKPLPRVATGCRRQRMVRRGSPVRVRKRALREAANRYLRGKGGFSTGSGSAGGSLARHEWTRKTVRVQPEIRYARCGDVAIAYAVQGAGPIDPVFVHGFAGNLDVELESPYMRAFHDRLASFSRFVMFRPAWHRSLGSDAGGPDSRNAHGRPPRSTRCGRFGGRRSLWDLRGCHL